MISVNKQEFIETFLLGLLLLFIGVIGLIIHNSMINLISFVLLAVYYLYCFSKKRIKKEQDDELSLENKYKSGYIMFFVNITIFLAIIGILLLSKQSFYFEVSINPNVLCILAGMELITYYLLFNHFERRGE